LSITGLLVNLVTPLVAIIRLSLVGIPETATYGCS
jgi:hypothetical protein